MKIAHKTHGGSWLIYVGNDFPTVSIKENQIILNLQGGKYLDQSWRIEIARDEFDRLAAKIAERFVKRAESEAS